ncbi:hypothetical protein ILP92_07075 [Maribius pontilimi]|uniref:Uncharacterized protein n=1 Tax=Palleronia pontilimi TaxID=1964209 RepID=A0A934I8V8_9RHOB|nr:hypothetical protein [Palleronia pontilimi]MBJ3762503.1 hypothetical protein [Palleronia pontilimi]
MEALTRLLDANSTLKDATSGLVKISKAAEKAKIPGACVVQLIAGGFLQHVVRIDGISGLEGLRVCPAEVKKVASTTLIGMTASEAFAALKLNKDAGWELVGRPCDEVSLTPYMVTGVGSDFTIARFLPESVAAFGARFTTLAHAADKHGTGVKDHRGSLKKIGVKPAVPWSDIGVEIYQVSDVAKVLPA